MKLRSSLTNWIPRTKEGAFTLIELLAIIVAIALLTIMLLPARADSRPKSQGIRCMDNLRQIMGAIMMYTHDNHDLFPPNPDDSNTIPGHDWCAGNAGVGHSQEFNPDVLADPGRCLITTYLNTNVALFRCPSDIRVGTYQGTDPGRIGTKVPAARSISMSQAVGTCCSSWVNGGGHLNGQPFVAVNGPWLDNNHSHRRNLPWRTYGKVSDTVIPGPAKLWVIIEEDIYSLNDSSFAVGMNIAEWIDWPGTRHAMSGNVAFADGHVELHKWGDQSTRVIGAIVARKAASADWVWLSERTSARAQ